MGVFAAFTNQSDIQLAMEESHNSAHLKRFDQAKAKMLAALETHLGNVSMASMETGIGRRTHYDWMAADPDYAAAVKELKNVAVDFYEQSLHDRIKAGSDAAVIFALKTQGKDRGWQEKSEMKVEHSYSNMTDEELEQRLAELAKKQDE